MVVDITTGIIVGSVLFAGVGIAVAFGLSFYVKLKTKDFTMKNDNAK